jgi:hypothetical protein
MAGKKGKYRKDKFYLSNLITRKKASRWRMMFEGAEEACNAAGIP